MLGFRTRFGSQFGHGRAGAARPVRPALECLEDRCVPAVIAGTTTTGVTDVFVKGLDDQIYYQQVNQNGQSVAAYKTTASGQVLDFRVTNTSSGGLEVFALGIDNQVYRRQFDTSGAPTAGGSWQLATNGQVKTFEVGPGTLVKDLFAIGLDSQVYGLKLTAAGDPTGGYFAGNPGAVKSISLMDTVNSSGQSEVFAIGLDSQVYLQKFDSSGNSVPGFNLVAHGAVESFIMKGTAFTNNQTGFALGLDNQVYSVKLDTTGATVSGYALTAPGIVDSIDVGGARQSAPLGPYGPQLFVTGLDGQVYSQKFDFSGTSLGGYSLVTNGQVKSVAVGSVLNANGGSNLFVVGIDNQLYGETLDGVGASTGGYFLTAPGQIK